MKKPVWVMRETVLALHDRLLAEFGGRGGLRDEAMLDSALGRAPNLWHYGTPDIPTLASAYAFGLVRNHPFVDGNKRIGFATSVLFLELNGFTFNASEVDATVQTLALAARDLDDVGYAGWMKRMSKRVTTPRKRTS